MAVSVPVDDIKTVLASNNIKNYEIADDIIRIAGEDISPLYDFIEITKNSRGKIFMRIKLQKSGIILAKEFKSPYFAYAIEYARDIARINDAIFKNFISAYETAEKYGYSIAKNELPMRFQLLAFTKTMNEGAIRIELDNDLFGFFYNINLMFHIDGVDAKELRKAIPDKSMLNGADAYIEKIKIEERGDFIFMKIKAEPSLSAFSDAIAIYNNIIQHSKEFLKLYEELRDRIKLDENVAILEFLYGIFTKDRFTNPSLIFGHLLRELSDVFYKTWKLDLRDMELTNDMILAELFKKGHIWFDESGRLLINGKSIYDMVASLSIRLDKDAIENLEKRTKSSLANFMGIDAMKTYLKKEGKINDKIIEALVPSSISVDDLLSIANGKKMICYFSEMKRKEIIMGLPLKEALKLYKAEPGVFAGFEDEFDKKIMKEYQELDGYFSYYIFSRHKELIGNSGAKIVIANEDSYIIIDGLYAKAIASKDGEITFLITDKKASAVAKGKTLADAVAEFKEKYEKIRNAQKDAKNVENIRLGWGSVIIPIINEKFLNINEIEK